MRGGPASHWFVQTGAATAIATARLGRADQNGCGSGDVLAVALVAVLLVVAEAPLATCWPANLWVEPERTQLVALGAGEHVRHDVGRVLEVVEILQAMFRYVSNSQTF